MIDANRDVDQYIRASSLRACASQVTETHIRGFDLRIRELAQRTRPVFVCPTKATRTGNAIRRSAALKDGVLTASTTSPFDVLHTPGHTPEHLTFLVTDGAAADQPIAAVTGDFIFVGDVGRPDLLERAANIRGTMEKGARVLWRSLQKFAAHEDWLQIWPGHGAGSACGKGISAIPSSTLGYERRFNWAFAIKTEDAFVNSVLAGQPEPPTYFATMKKVNQAGPAILNGFHLPDQLDAATLPALLARQALVIDTRPAAGIR